MILSARWSCGSYLASRLRHRRSGQCVVPLETPRSSSTTESYALVLATRNITRPCRCNWPFINFKSSRLPDSWASVVRFTSEVQALDIATQCHIHHLIREFTTGVPSTVFSIFSMVCTVSVPAVSRQSPECSAPVPETHRASHLSCVKNCSTILST